MSNPAKSLGKARGPRVPLASLEERVRLLEELVAALRQLTLPLQPLEGPNYAPRQE